MGPSGHWLIACLFQVSFPGGSVVKNLPATLWPRGDTGSIPGLGIKFLMSVMNSSLGPPGQLLSCRRT